MAAAQATPEQMQAMVLQLIANVDQLTNRLTQIEGRLAKGGDDRDDKGLVDKKFFLPEIFATQKQIFREWAEEFVDFIRSRDSRMADLLDESAHYKEVITNFGDDETKSRVMYRVLKKLVTHADARHLIQHVTGGNVYEAWRQLHNKFDPQNDAAAARTVSHIMNVQNWKCKHISEVPVMLARWEGLQREHKTRSGEDALTMAGSRNMLIEMIPTAMREHIRVQTMLLKREDLTYEKLRMYILDMAQQVASVATPMDVSALAEPDGKFEGHEQPDLEPMDSFGNRPKGGGVGKGDAKGDGKHTGNHTAKTCDICNRKGHSNIDWV